MSKIFNFGEVVKEYNVKVINEREARAGAGILFLFALLSFLNCIYTKNLFLTQIFIWAFLGEFIIRVLINPKYAPTLIIGRFMVNNQTPEYVGATQKRFAWGLGLFLALFLFGLITLFPSTTPIEEESLHNVLIGLSCITCLVLLYFESVFGICLGCNLYNLLGKDNTKYCGGNSCEKSNRQECQKISITQVVILILFLAVLMLIIGNI